MLKENEERLWEKIRDASNKMKTDLEKLSHVLTGVIVTTGEDTKTGIELKMLKDELDRIKIYVSEYEPYSGSSRYINIRIPSYFSSGNGGEKQYNMGRVLYCLPQMILSLNDIEKRLLEAEAENMPGGASSMKNDGLAKEMLSAIHEFKNAVLVYANEV